MKTSLYFDAEDILEVFRRHYPSADIDVSPGSRVRVDLPWEQAPVPERVDVREL